VNGNNRSIGQRNARARERALEAAARLEAAPTGLVRFESAGRLLVIGDGEALARLPLIGDGLETRLLSTGGEKDAGAAAVRQRGRNLRVEGHLGRFHVHLANEDGSDAETLEADLVLDLGATPLLERELAPPGYLHAPVETAALQQAIGELATLVGTFEKPVYVDYDPSICAHGRSGLTACSRCIDSCPARAITGLAEAVEIDTHLCQGGGICATVCPSGAIRYAYPRARDTLDRLRLLLQAYRREGGEDPVVLLHAAEDGDGAGFDQGNLLPLALEELGSAGLEVWLSALAYGARRLVLVDGGSATPGTLKALASQVGIGREILGALGYPVDAVALVDEGGWREAVKPLMPGIEPAGFHGLEAKRQALFMAIDHLHDQAGRPRPVAPLSVGAPFGTAEVDGKRCTLCMACVGACPGRALQHGGQTPELGFIESACIQCGICTRTCPEDAIWITPRLLFDREARNRKRVLCEDQPFCCTACGRPFATRSVIENTLAKLRGHWMFQDERARRRLTLCDNCRVVDAVQDPALLNGGPEGSD